MIYLKIIGLATLVVVVLFAGLGLKSLFGRGSVPAHSCGCKNADTAGRCACNVNETKK